MQEAQAQATQQVEAIALAVSMVLGGDKSGGGSEARKPQDAAELSQGLTAFMNMGKG